MKGPDHYVVPDDVFGKRTDWRITPPDGILVEIRQDHVEASGLQAKLMDGDREEGAKRDG